MKSAIFITSGIGNALYLVPLIKSLKEKGTVTCLAASSFRSHEIFRGFEDRLFDEVIEVGGAVSWPRFAAALVNRYDRVYLDFFASTKKNLVLASFLGKTVVTNHIPESLPRIFRGKIKHITPVIGLHEGTQYLLYVNPAMKDADLDESMFSLKPVFHKPILDEDYITIQPGSGNNKTPWKTWPVDAWTRLCKLITDNCPGLNIAVLGDETEETLSGVFESYGSRVRSFIGKTTLASLPSLMAGSKLHIGGDSAMLHIAGCVGTPTVTICGGSDPQIFGWSKVNAEKHVLIKHTIACHPCYRWIAPNTSRVDDPARCPDFKCIRSIDETEVFRAVMQQLKP